MYVIAKKRQIHKYSGQVSVCQAQWGGGNKGTAEGEQDFFGCKEYILEQDSCMAAQYCGYTICY